MQDLHSWHCIICIICMFLNVRLSNAPSYFGQFEFKTEEEVSIILIIFAKRLVTLGSLGTAWETGWPTGPHRAQGHDHFLAARSPLGELQLARRKSHISATNICLNKFLLIFHKFLATISAQTVFSLRGHCWKEETYFWCLIYFWRASTSRLSVSWSSSLSFVCCPARVDKKGWNVARSSQRDRSAFRWAGTEVFAPLLYLQAAHMFWPFQSYAQGNGQLVCQCCPILKVNKF